MANKLFNNAMYTRKNKLVSLFLDVVIGAAGAVTSFDGDVIEDVLLVAPGEYQIVLADRFYSFLNMTGIIVAAAEEDLRLQVKAADMDAKTIDIFTLTGAVATAPAAGTVLKLELKFNDSSVR